MSKSICNARYFIYCRIDGVKKSKWTCVREDGRDLVEEWKTEKEKDGVTYAFVDNKEDFQKVYPNSVDHLLGNVLTVLKEYFV